MQTFLLRGCLEVTFFFFILLVLVLTICNQHPCPRSKSERTRDLKVNCAKAEQPASVWVLPGGCSCIVLNFLLLPKSGPQMSTESALERSNGSESEAHIPWYVVMGILKVPAKGSPLLRPELIPGRLNAKCPASHAVKPLLRPLSLYVDNKRILECC